MPPRAAARSMKTASPLGQGGTSGGLGFSDNLVWVVDPETHAGASVKASQAFTPSEGGDFQGSGVTFSDWLVSDLSEAARSQINREAFVASRGH
jgi:hypothetical protein